MANASTTTNGKRPLTNVEIAQRLDRMAELLDAQHANPYRVRAYRVAANEIRGLKPSVSSILRTKGIEGLQQLPTIGVSLSRSIEQLIETGKISLLEQLLGQTRPERVLATVPGIGPKLAERIHDQLGIETLIELQQAAYDGRLDRVPGFGRGRLRAARETLAGRFRQAGRAARAPLRSIATPSNQPLVKELLDVDREYRAKVDGLPRIAPVRFNPTGEVWLPILHIQRGQTHYTALYSNTARAHELGTTKDWVVIYRDDHQGAGQWTVITSQFGRLYGRRIVRGREAGCEAINSPSAIGQQTSG
jgi:hypothetical protein